MEFAGGPPGMPPFASYILQRIWEVSLEVHASSLLSSQGVSFCCCFDFVVVVLIFFFLLKSNFTLSKTEYSKIEWKVQILPTHPCLHGFCFFILFPPSYISVSYLGQMNQVFSTVDTGRRNIKYCFFSFRVIAVRTDFLVRTGKALGQDSVNPFSKGQMPNVYEVLQITNIC